MHTNTGKSSAWLALLLSCLIALPTTALADDTELFTSTANPNVLLMLDTTGSMSDTASGTSVGDLDGQDGTSTSTKMDILWKVVYTLLNADLSTPSFDNSSTVTVSGRLLSAKRTDRTTVSSSISNSSGRYYEYVILDGINNTSWAQFPGGPTSGGTARIGSFSVWEYMTYSSRSSGAPYTLYFSPAKHFDHDYSQGATISYTYSAGGGSVLYPENFPTNHTQAMSTDFLNNLNTVDDENILKARIGLMTFSSAGAGLNIWRQVNPPPTSPNAPPFIPSYRDIWSTVTAEAYANGGTPTARALNRAQDFFDTATANNTVDICRQNFAVMVTDGEDTLGGLDGASGNGGGPDYYSGSGTSGTFYPDGNPGTSNNRGQVGRNNAVIQEAANLKTHSPSVKLYTVGVGISDDVPHLRVLREVLRRAAEQNNARADVGASNPNTGVYYNIGLSGDNTARAAGKAFFATDANELAISLRNIFQQITAGMYSFTAPTVASVRMTDRNYLYKATFTPAAPPATYWEGHLEALSINSDGTMTSQWDAGNVLRGTTPGNRNIYTSDNTGSRINFTTGVITPGMLGVDNTAARDAIVNYVLGANHDNNSKLGDIFHSKPVVVGPPSRFFFDEGYSTAVGPPDTAVSFVEAKTHRKRVVYVGTNDGMLHGFLSGTFQVGTGQYDSGTGAELFGYVPHNILGNLENFLPGDVTRHGYFVDASPRVADVWIDNNADGIKQSSEWKTVLIGGMRKGGNSYFGLDVSDPDASDYPKVLWEYTDAAHLGQTWSEPFIGKVRMKESPSADAKDRWVAIFGGGKTDDGMVGASLVVLDISTGNALKTFTSTDGIDNVIPASPTAILDASGYIKFVYVADLDGTVYKFDFRTTGLRSTGFGEWRVNKIFQASAGQPAYHRVEAGSVTENLRYLYFGTGDQEFPISNLGTGKFYAIKDADTDNTLLRESNLTELSRSITSLTGGTVGSSKSGWFISFDNVASTADDTKTHSGEKVLSDPVAFYNGVYFTTFTPNAADPCGGGGVARVYGLNMLNAGAYLAPIAGETATTKIPYHVFSGGAGSEGGIPSSPSLSIYPSGQSSIFVGFSTGVVKEIKIESPPQMKTIKSWKETF